MDVEQVRTVAFEQHYEPMLVALSILVAVMAVYTALLVLERVRSRESGWRRIAWLGAGSLALGGGIWAMHFIGLLALSLPVEVHYHILPTLISILPVFIASLLLLICSARTCGSRLRMIGRGVLLGMGIGLMHHMGMHAMDLDAEMRYDRTIFVVSLVVALGLAIFAVTIKKWAVSKCDSAISSDNRVIVAAVLMGIAFSVIHYFSMAAMEFIPGVIADTDTPAWSPAEMAVLIGIVMASILLLLISAVFISRRFDLLEQLQDSETRIKTVFETVLDGIITIDEQGLIDALNPAAEHIFGYGPGELLGKPISMLMPQSDSRRHNNYLSDYKKTGHGRVISEGRDVNGVRKDGSEFPIDLSVNMASINGQRMFIGVVHDMSQHKQIEANLREACAMAELANKAKSEFLATMSHEIRTPMNGVLGMLHLLHKTELDKKQRRFVDTAAGSGELLLTVINDILDFSKMEADKLELESLTFDVTALVEETAILLASAAQDKGLELICKLEPTLPKMVKGDPTRIRQVLTNLLSNAIKFTEQGEVVVYAKQEDGRIRLGVVDTGIGLTPEQQQSVFTAFSQADSTTTRKYGGTGLGLAISTRLVAAMDGELGVKSTSGVGSEFSFALPLQVVDVNQYRQQASESLPKQRILIVDDNQTNREVLDNILQNWQIANVSQVESGADALVQLRAAVTAGQAYDIALLDMHMPEMDGLQLARAIRSDTSLRGMNLIMLSSLDRAESTPELDIWLTKPIRQSDLYNSLLQLIGEKGGGLIKNDVQLATDALWFGGRRLLLVEDNAINQEVAREILSDRGFIIDICDNGLQALQAVQENHYDAVLMDIQMPVMDGFEATRQIRALGGAFNTLPIIAMTANALSGDEEKSLAAGMNVHVTKPINPQAVFATLAQWIESSQLPKGKSMKRTEIDLAGIPELPGIDMLDAMQRLNGDWELYKTVFRSFHQRHARTATTIEAHIRQGELESAACLAHNLKGTSGNLAATGLFCQAGKLESACLEGDSDHALSMLEGLQRHLDGVMSGIELLGDDAHANLTEIATETKVLDRNALSQLLDQLQGCIETDLGEAQVCLKKLWLELQGTAYAVKLENVEASMNRFDTEETIVNISLLKADLL